METQEDLRLEDGLIPLPMKSGLSVEIDMVAMKGFTVE